MNGYVESQAQLAERAYRIMVGEYCKKYKKTQVLTARANALAEIARTEIRVTTSQAIREIRAEA